MIKTTLVFLLLGAFIVIFITRPLYKIAEKIENLSNKVQQMSINFDHLIESEKKPYLVGGGSLSIQQSLGGLQGGFANMTRSLDETNKEFKSLNEKINKSRLLKF